MLNSAVQLDSRCNLALLFTEENLNCALLYFTCLSGTPLFVVVFGFVFLSRLLSNGSVRSWCDGSSDSGPIELFLVPASTP